MALPSQAQEGREARLAAGEAAQGVVGRRSLASPAKNAVYSCNHQEMADSLERPWLDPYGMINFSRKPGIDGAVVWESRFDIAPREQSIEFSGNGLPGHPTGEFPIKESSPAFRYDRNPNSIRSYALQYSTPAMPRMADVPGCLPMGVIGIALSGGVFFNALDGPGRDAVAHEIFDKCEGHPERNGRYHYHHDSPCFDQGDIQSHSPLLGYALDGFGIYGSRDEGGAYISNAQLDECHGHLGPVPSEGGDAAARYHYHINREFPYTLGCFKGIVTLASERPESRPGQNQAKILSRGGFSVITLGTGGPRHSPQRAGPSALVRIGETQFLVDMGRDTQARLAQADIRLRDVDALMFTHHHLDHNEEFVPIFLGARRQGGGSQVVGPPGTRALVDFVLEFYKEDSDYRAARTGRSSDAMRNVSVREVSGGETFTLAGVKITTAQVNHTIHTVAYRLEADGKSIVISGDLTYSPTLVDLARGADVLVVDSGRVAALSRGRIVEAPRRIEGHASVDEVAAMAQRAGVKRLVLTHFGRDNFDEAAVRSRIGETFAGTLIFATDLLEIRP